MGSIFTRSDANTPSSTDSEEDKTRIQVNKWDTSAVKNAIDDAAKQVAEDKFKFSETFHLVNIRLAISCLAVSFALFALVYDFMQPFPKSKYVLATCSLSYFFMMGIFTLFTLLKEKNIVYQGDDMETVVGMPARLEFATCLKKYQNIFQFSMAMRNGPHAHAEVEFEFGVEKYFTEEGVLLKDKLEQLLTENFNKIAHVRDGTDKKESKKTN